MKKILLVLVLLCTTYGYSQEKTFESEVRKISKKIEQITKSEKEALREKVEKINSRLEKKEITAEEATKLKKEAAEYHAEIIAKKVSVEEKNLQLLVQNKANGKIKSSELSNDFDDDRTFSIGNKTFRIRVNDEDYFSSRRNDKRKKRKTKWERKGKRNRSTTTQFVFAMGVNNVLVDNQLSSLDDSSYKFWQSHFYELGWTWKTRFDKQASKLYLKYGVSFLWNNLRADNNKYHVINGNTTDLVMHQDVLSESRFRNVQMTFPVHIEWDFSRNGEYSDGHKRDRTNKSIRLGIGAFAGFKLGTRQYLEFKNATGTKVEELQKAGFNTSTLNYGVSAYLAWRSAGLYVKYDLNPLFKDTEIRNLSMGIRWDIN